MTRIGVAVLVVAWLGPVSVGATLLHRWSTAELARRSESVYVADVMRQRSFVGPYGIMTESDLRVWRVLKGSQAVEVVLTQLGGRVGTLEREIVGDARLRVGDRVVVFTHVAGDGRRYLVGMGLGALRLEGEFLRPTGDTPEVEAPGSTVRTLAELETVLRRAVGIR